MLSLLDSAPNLLQRYYYISHRILKYCRVSCFFLTHSGYTLPYPSLYFCTFLTFSDVPSFSINVATQYEGRWTVPHPVWVIAHFLTPSLRIYIQLYSLYSDKTRHVLTRESEGSLAIGRDMDPSESRENFWGRSDLPISVWDTPKDTANQFVFRQKRLYDWPRPAQESRRLNAGYWSPWVSPTAPPVDEQLRRSSTVEIDCCSCRSLSTNVVDVADLTASCEFGVKLAQQDSASGTRCRLEADTTGGGGGGGGKGGVFDFRCA